MSKSAKPTFPETDSTEIAQRIEGKVTARVESVSRFRKNLRRIDYYPGPDALKEVDRMRELNPAHTIGQLIDYLVLQGIKPTSGNTSP